MPKSPPLILERVLHAASRGWRLLPVKAHGKAPRILEWQKVATCDVAQAEAWEKQFPGCNWGMATGPGSGVFVFDVDGEPGRKALDARNRQGEALPDTLTVSTGRGNHFYFRWPVGKIIRNSAGKLAKGLDIRGDGGYVVIPPSVHSNGTQYAFDDPNTPIADAPVWLLELITGNEAPAFQPLEAKIVILPEGRRNDGLTRLGGALRRRGANQEEIERSLTAENIRRCRPRLPIDEVRKIAASVARYEPGGPDPLETAWAVVLGETRPKGYERFLGLARHLQLARPGLAIALPLQRIGALMKCDWTQVRRWRHRAECEGYLIQKEPYVAHRRATLYLFEDVPLGIPKMSH